MSCAVCKGRRCDLQAPVDSVQDMEEVKDTCFSGVGAFEMASLNVNSECSEQLLGVLPGLT